jgi:hypothetical protein
MKLIMISAFAAVALVAATTMLRSHTPAADHASGSSGMRPLQELQTAPDEKNLPVEDFDGQALVYSRTMQ